MVNPDWFISFISEGQASAKQKWLFNGRCSDHEEVNVQFAKDCKCTMNYVTM